MTINELDRFKCTGVINVEVPRHKLLLIFLLLFTQNFLRQELDTDGKSTKEDTTGENELQCDTGDHDDTIIKLISYFLY